MSKSLIDLGFYEVKKENEIWFCDGMQQPYDYFGTIVFDLTNQQVSQHIRQELYNQKELNQAIEIEKAKVFKKVRK